MKHIHLPHKKRIHHIILGFWGIPCLVFCMLYLFEEDKLEMAQRGLAWYSLPSFFMLLLLLPPFQFKSEKKVPVENAILKLPFGEIMLGIPLAISLLFLFTGIASYLDQDPKPLPEMIFFSLLISIALLFTLNSNKILFKGEYQTTKDKLNWQKRKTSLGSFIFTEEGFSIKNQTGSLSINWEEIASILAYKEDLYTADRICLLIQKLDDTALSISEETEGYFIFKEKMTENLPGLSKQWELTLMYPAFEPNPAWIYKKEKDLS